MTAGEGIFVRALGDDFARLHPQLQRRFGVGVAAGYGCIGRGVMTELRRGAWWTVPFLRFGTLRNIMFPERARDVPFRIDNHPYIDGYGRETVTFVRTMQVSPRRRRRFDATMIHSAQRGGLIARRIERLPRREHDADVLGRQHLEVARVPRGVARTGGRTRIHRANRIRDVLDLPQHAGEAHGHGRQLLRGCGRHQQDVLERPATQVHKLPRNREQLEEAQPAGPEVDGCGEIRRWDRDEHGHAVDPAEQLGGDGIGPWSRDGADVEGVVEAVLRHGG